MKLALAQLDVKADDVEGNVDRARSAIASGATDGADLVALPEIFNVGYFSFDQYRDRSEPLSGPTLSAMAAAAQDHGVAVLAGTIVEDLARTDGPTPADEGLANAAVLFDDRGNRQLVYRKHHLFGYESAEAELLVPGERLETADIGGFTVGVTTCYDLRFPELYRDLAEQGASLVLVPSAWPYPRVEHWRVLSRTRAIENQFFLGTINGSGTFDGTTLLGRSTVYDPWGNPLASTGDEPSIVTATIDPDRVTTVRDEFPAWHDRRR
ncbi:MAG: putative amidohydrolase [Halobacteriales archaeon]|jgi:predicted amidohydrolase